MNSAFRFVGWLGLISALITGVDAEETLEVAKSFLRKNAVLTEYPVAPADFETVRSKISQTADPESKFGYIVFSIARHGEKLLNETQREQLDALIEQRSTTELNWHDVRNMVRVKAQIAMWEFADETDPDLAAKKKEAWNAWTDLRVAYMKQEFIDKERFQGASWNILTKANIEDLRSGKWDRYFKKSTGHKRLFSADKQISRILGKPEHTVRFAATETAWRKKWDVMWNSYEAESLFERKREFAMDLADEAFSITSWRTNYVPAFRAFAEHECDAIRELLQSGYTIDNGAVEKIATYRRKLQSDASEKYANAPQILQFLLP